MTKQKLAVLGGTTIAIGLGVMNGYNEHNTNNSVDGDAVKTKSVEGDTTTTKISDKKTGQSANDNESTNGGAIIKKGRTSNKKVNFDESSIKVKLQSKEDYIKELRSLNDKLGDLNNSYSNKSINLSRYVGKINDANLAKATENFVNKPTDENSDKLKTLINEKKNQSRTSNQRGVQVIDKAISSRVANKILRDIDSIKEYNNELQEVTQRQTFLSEKITNLDNAKQKSTEKEKDWKTIKTFADNNKTIDVISEGLNINQDLADSIKSNTSIDNNNSSASSASSSSASESISSLAKTETSSEASSAISSSNEQSSASTFSSSSSEIMNDEQSSSAEPVTPSNDTKTENDESTSNSNNNDNTPSSSSDVIVNNQSDKETTNSASVESSANSASSSVASTSNNNVTSQENNYQKENSTESSASSQIASSAESQQSSASTASSSSAVDLSNQLNQSIIEQANQDSSSTVNVNNTNVGVNGFGTKTYKDDLHHISVTNKFGNDLASAYKNSIKASRAAGSKDRINGTMTEAQREEFNQYVIDKINQYRKASGLPTNLVMTNPNVLKATITRSLTSSAMTMKHDSSITSSIFKNTPGAGIYSGESLAYVSDIEDDETNNMTTLEAMADIMIDGMINDDGDSNYGHRFMLLQPVSSSGTYMGAAINIGVDGAYMTVDSANLN